MTIHENGATPEKPESEATAGAPQLDPSEALREQLAEEKNKYLYLFAEFENYKKRMIKERADALKFGWEPVAREMLQVVDNLGRALAHMDPATDKNLADGLKMVLSQFEKSLEKSGVVAIQAVGQAFDPNLHEAMGQEPSELPSGTVTREIQRGFTLHGRLLRPAQVMVSAQK